MATAPEGDRADPVRVETPADGVRVVRLADASGHNPLSSAATDALLAALAAAEADGGCRVVILSGGPDYFSTGASRAVLEALRDGRTRPTELGLARRLLTLDVPVVAACSGGAVGGGFVLATACDLVVLAAERRYGFNFMDLGITPGMGVTALAEHVLGAAVAHELLYGGELRRGADLGACPGVGHVVPSAEVEARALDVALRIAAKDRSNLSMLKRALTVPRRRRLEEALTLESLMHERSLSGLELDALGDAPS